MKSKSTLFGDMKYACWKVSPTNELGITSSGCRNEKRKFRNFVPTASRFIWTNCGLVHHLTNKYCLLPLQALEHLYRRSLAFIHCKDRFHPFPCNISTTITSFCTHLASSLLQPSLSSSMKLAGTYLTFNGNCREAMTFYAKVLNTKIDASMTWADSKCWDDGKLPTEKEPPKNLAATEENQHLMMHMSFMLDNGTSVMGSDVHPLMHKNPLVNGNNYQLVLEPDTQEEAIRIFEALKEGGSDGMPMQDMWWGSFHGSCRDRFGIRWMFDMASYTSEEAKMKHNLMSAVGALRTSAKIAHASAAKLEALIEEPALKKAKVIGEEKMDSETLELS
jgi:PhnB protein